MLVPDKKEFLRFARQPGVTLIPVVKNVGADLLTPVSAFLKIAASEPESFLLESVEGGEHVVRNPQAQEDADLIQAEFGEGGLEALATLDRQSTASLVGVDDLDAVAGPAERDGDVGQRILARGRLLVLGHLLGIRLADINEGFPIEVMVADLGGPRRQQVGRQEDRARRGGERWRSRGEFRCAHD